MDVVITAWSFCLLLAKANIYIESLLWYDVWQVYLLWRKFLMKDRVMFTLCKQHCKQTGYLSQEIGRFFWLERCRLFFTVCRLTRIFRYPFFIRKYQGCTMKAIKCLTIRNFCPIAQERLCNAQNYFFWFLVSTLY